MTANAQASPLTPAELALLRRVPGRGRPLPALPVTRARLIEPFRFDDPDLPADAAEPAWRTDLRHAHARQAVSEFIDCCEDALDGCGVRPNPATQAKADIEAMAAMSPAGDDPDTARPPRITPLPPLYTGRDLVMWFLMGGLSGAAVAILFYLIWVHARLTEIGAMVVQPI